MNARQDILGIVTLIIFLDHVLIRLSFSIIRVFIIERLKARIIYTLSAHDTEYEWSISIKLGKCQRFHFF